MGSSVVVLRLDFPVIPLAARGVGGGAWWQRMVGPAAHGGDVCFRSCENVGSVHELFQFPVVYPSHFPGVLGGVDLHPTLSSLLLNDFVLLTPVVFAVI